MLILSLVALVVTMGPTLAYKMNVSINVMKYLTTIALGGLVALMASDYTIGIYMTYALAMVFSILYYDSFFLHYLKSAVDKKVQLSIDEVKDIVFSYEKNEI